MKSVNNVTSVKMLAIMPEQFKGLDYVKLKENDEKTINHVAYSVYPAKDKDGLGITRKDGSIVYRTTAYIAFTDNTYTTTKYDLPISQLVSETGMYPDNQPGITIYDCDCKVKAVSVSVRMGQKDYAIIAFEPL